RGLLILVMSREPVRCAGKQWQVAWLVSECGLESAVGFVGSIQLKERDHFAGACRLVFRISGELFVVECECFFGFTGSAIKIRETAARDFRRRIQLERLFVLSRGFFES